MTIESVSSDLMLVGIEGRPHRYLLPAYSRRYWSQSTYDIKSAMIPNIVNKLISGNS